MTAQMNSSQFDVSRSVVTANVANRRRSAKMAHRREKEQHADQARPDDAVAENLKRGDVLDLFEVDRSEGPQGKRRHAIGKADDGRGPDESDGRWGCGHGATSSG